MKIRNLAFCGVMASILGVSGAYAAGDATIIASKAYVDARDNAKQDKDDRFTGTWTEAETANVDDSTVKYPSMKTLKNVKDGLESSISTNVTNNAYTDNALDATALTNTNKAKLAKVEAIQNTAKRAQTGNTVTSWNTAETTTSSDAYASDDLFPTVKAVAQQVAKTTSDLQTRMDNADESIKNNFEKGMAPATVTAYNTWATNPNETNTNALTEAISSDTTLDNVVSDTRADHANLIPRNSNIQKGIAYMKGNGIVNHTAGVGNEALTQNMAAADTAWKQEFENRVADDHVPTVAAVEARVKAAVTEAGTNASNLKDTAASATWNSQNNTLTIVTDADTAGNKTDKLATSNQVQTSVSALKSYVDNADSGKANKGNVTAASTDFNIVTYNATGAVNSGKALTQTGLNNINQATNSGTTCSASNPCVLTYTGTDYKWTNMDTDSLSAVADTNTNS